MAVREFDGTDDRVTLDNGALGAINNGPAFSAVMLAYPASSTDDYHVFWEVAGGSTEIQTFGRYPTANEVFLAFPGNTANQNVGYVAGAWALYGVSKAAGAAAPRFHRGAMSGGAWHHATHGATCGLDATVATAIYVGALHDGAIPMGFQLATLAFWTSNLADADFENMRTNATTAFLDTLNPDVLLDFNQASTATAVTDLTGGGADQTAITGTTVVTTNDPAWTFGLAAPAEKQSFYSFRRRSVTR